MSADNHKTIESLMELGRVLATAEEELRIAQRMAAHLPGDWTNTIHEMATYVENTGYAIDQQCLRLQEQDS